MTFFKFDKWLRYGIWHLDRKEFYDYPCVYVFYVNERLVYVGQTNNMNNRLMYYKIRKIGNNIFTKWGKVGDIYIKVKFSSKYGKEAMIEKRLIDRLKPLYNRQVIPRRKLIDSRY